MTGGVNALREARHGVALKTRRAKTTLLQWPASESGQAA
jgi:hypothetical protein